MEHIDLALQYEYDVGSLASSILEVSKEGAAQICSRVRANMSMPVVISSILTAIIISRAMVFAAPRVFAPLSLKQRILLRGPVIAAILYVLPTYLQELRGAELPKEYGFFWGDIVLKMSLFIETICSIRTQVDGNICIYSYSELILIIDEFRRAENRPDTQVGLDSTMFLLGSLVTQLLIQLEGLLDLKDRYRFFTSLCGTLIYFAHFVFLITSGHLLLYPMLTFFASIRFIPLTIMWVLLISCWTVFAFTAVFIGANNMALYSQYDSTYIVFSETFNENVLRLATTAFQISSNGQMLNEAKGVTVASPYENYEPPKPEEKRPETQMFNPVGEITTNIRTAWDMLNHLTDQHGGQAEEEDDDYIPESDLESEIDASDNSEAEDGPPITETIEICGGDILQRHVERGRLTRSSYRKSLSEAYLRAKSKYSRAGPESCVVCLESPRDIVLWPCGCLSVCEECRVALGIHNEKTCVCCRRKVTGYSRIFRP